MSLRWVQNLYFHYIYIPWDDCAAAPSPSVPWTCCDNNCDMTSASNESSSAPKPFWDAAASEQIESWNEASSWGDNAPRPSFPIWLCLRIKLVQTIEKLLCLKTIQLPSWEMCVTITPYSQTWGCKGTHWWEYSPSTNVALVRILTPTPYVGWVCCWFSPLLQEVFLWVLRFSHLLKKPIPPYSNSIWNALTN